MDYQPQETFRSDPRYQQALHDFQRGKWRTGLDRLRQVQEDFPLEQELRSLSAEMQLRAKIDYDEQIDRRVDARRRLVRISTRVAAGVLLVLVVFFGVGAYANTIQRQWDSARLALEEEARSLELAVKFRNAQNLLSAGRAQEAVLIFNEIAQVDPKFPNLDYYLSQADQLGELETNYANAIALINNGDLNNALELLETIQRQQPNYKDVSQRIENVRSKLLLEDLFNEAEIAFASGDWQKAIANYESLSAIDITYKRDEIDVRLLESYIKAAEQALEAPEQSLENLEIANQYFRKALALRPRDREILARLADSRESVANRLVNSYVLRAQQVLASEPDIILAQQTAEGYLRSALALRPDDLDITTQFELVKRYLVNLENFNRGDIEAVIAGMPFVVDQDQNYAGGSARQMLYDAFVAHGNNYVAIGEHDLALADYQQAGLLAAQTPVSTLRLYEAQLKMAYAQGLLFNYGDAVLLYRSAAELAELNERASSNPEVTNALIEAEDYAASGDFRQAYLRYRDALRRSSELYDYVEYTVQEGDYLTILATQYQSTVAAISETNDISNPNRIYIGQVLLIPSLRTTG